MKLGRRTSTSSLVAGAFALSCASAPMEDTGSHVAAGSPVVQQPVAMEVKTCPQLAIPPEPAGLARIPAPFDPPRIPIVRPEALANFYEALARLLRGEADHHVRVAVFGDSNLTMDFTTGRLRRRLQRWFGDGGHGFVALGKPWTHYIHMDVRHGIAAGWQSYAITTKPTGDGFYGLGGIVADSEYGGATAFVATAPEGSLVGARAGQFDFFYIARPKGGAVDLVLDGRKVGRVETLADKPKLAWHRVEAPDGPHRLEVVAAKGSVRAVGVTLERAQPGVVIDSFGVGSLNTKSLGRHDASAFKEMVARRQYDLVVFLTGANDLFTMDAVPETLHRVLGWCREGSPTISALMATPPDRGLRKPMELTQAVAAQRRLVAEQEGVALWDQYEAMGGAGAMAKFVRNGLAVDDAIHYNEKGAAFVADRLLDALMQGFAAYLETNTRAGCSDGR